MLLFSYLYNCIIQFSSMFIFFFFNDTATTEIYTLSLHDALPIYVTRPRYRGGRSAILQRCFQAPARSEEHTSELQSPCNLVCRLLLEKKKKTRTTQNVNYQLAAGEFVFSSRIISRYT